MTEVDEERAIGRIHRLLFAIGAGGAILAFAARGWTWGAGFLIGAAASWLTFHALKRSVDGLAGAKPTRASVAVLAGLRYGLLGAGAYVILKYSSISATAALMGLFASAAAVIVEIIIQLVYARN